MSPVYTSTCITKYYGKETIHIYMSHVYMNHVYMSHVPCVYESDKEYIHTEKKPPLQFV